MKFLIFFLAWLIVAGAYAIISGKAGLDMVLMSVFWGIVIVGSYFLPYIMAWEKKHKDRTAIGVVNFFLGWTLLGWVVALVWAVKK